MPREVTKRRLYQLTAAEVFDALNLTPGGVEMKSETHVISDVYLNPDGTIVLTVEPNEAHAIDNQPPLPTDAPAAKSGEEE